MILHRILTSSLTPRQPTRRCIQPKKTEMRGHLMENPVIYSIKLQRRQDFGFEMPRWGPNATRSNIKTNARHGLSNRQPAENTVW